MAIRTFLLDEADYAKAQKKESPPNPKLDSASAEWARKILDLRLSEYSTSIEARPPFFFVPSDCASLR